VLSKEEFFGEHATWNHPMTDGCMAVRSDFIMNFPAADVIPIKHGKWIEKIDPWDRQHVGECSECGKIYCDYMYFRFCPNCGAKMDMKGMEKMNDITCENCAYRQSCPVMYSYNNAACLVIRKFD
jgi:NADH pyrophosphatase NudC (nudix superfamily)